VVGVHIALAARGVGSTSAVVGRWKNECREPGRKSQREQDTVNFSIKNATKIFSDGETRRCRP
jgi:hypothetical protein